ncbi:MAG TPA: DMT family transporter [Burkholderiales bacterium]|nr:DMT family transporter [Burkholderiales bacterium]
MHGSAVGSQSHALRGVAWMLGAVLSFALMAVAVRELLRHMDILQILSLRTAVTLVLVCTLIPRYGFAPLRTQRFPAHATRAVMHLAGQFCWMYAIGALTLATVFAIEFTMPVWTAILAALFLGERLNPGRLVQLALGLIGVAIILRPGLGAFHPAALVMILGSMLYSGSMIFTKRLSATDSALAVTFWMSAVQMPITLVASASSWVAPVLSDMPWILAIGAGSFAAHYSMTRAMKLADATVVVPIDFIRLPLIAVVGALFYAERFDPMVLVGAAVIFTGTYYSLTREHRK